MNDLYKYQKNAIWIKEYPIRYAGTKFNSRMTIVRLTNSNLMIHSPCDIDEPTKASINKLGKVEFIIAPSNFHYFYISSAQEAFPDAETLICPGVEIKIPNIKFNWFLGDQPDPRLIQDFEQVLVRGSKYMWEIAFFHKKTRTLILVDLIENFTDKTAGVSWSLKFWWKAIFHMWANPKPAPEYQFGWKDKKSACGSLNRILQWDFDKIIVSHGDLIEENAKKVASLSWRRILKCHRKA
ncbi:DUF4336 domain-containing protein [Neptunicella marina]|uniref:DUF4336 domain-containing protein n=1 Tax=Neptunicella marina TaxID=2125989 RepID=A0A8J6ISB9_9ALTE|nr:DUF4336 domain-containing protein [Neptunicella marina]MBC3764696.1 DUF4336 domain-containing protein [Neptunicella marina]